MFAVAAGRRDGFGPALHGQGTTQPLFNATQTYSSYGNNKAIDDKIAAQVAFAKLPRNSCMTRKNNRCALTGRSRGFYKKFGVSRIMLRELALAGQLPGVRKSSW